MYSNDSLAQLGKNLQQAVDSDGNPFLSVYEEIETELKNRCNNNVVTANHLFDFHANAFKVEPSAEKFNQLYAMAITLQSFRFP